MLFRYYCGRRVSEMTAGAGGDGGMGGEVIEVQILPQDDNWGDNTTAITGNTSVRSESFQVSQKKNWDAVGKACLIQNEARGV